MIIGKLGFLQLGIAIEELGVFCDEVAEYSRTLHFSLMVVVLLSVVLLSVIYAIMFWLFALGNILQLREWVSWPFSWI